MSVHLPKIKRDRKTHKFLPKVCGDYIVFHGDYGTRNATWDGQRWLLQRGGDPISWREKELYEVNGPIPGTTFEREPTIEEREKLARDTAWAYCEDDDDTCRARQVFDAGWEAALKWHEEGRP